MEKVQREVVGQVMQACGLSFGRQEGSEFKANQSYVRPCFKTNIQEDARRCWRGGLAVEVIYYSWRGPGFGSQPYMVGSSQPSIHNPIAEDPTFLNFCVHQAHS